MFVFRFLLVLFVFSSLDQVKSRGVIYHNQEFDPFISFPRIGLQKVKAEIKAQGLKFSISLPRILGLLVTHHDYSITKWVGAVDPDLR